MKIKQVIIESIMTLHANNPDSKPIIASLQDTYLGYKLNYMPSYTKKIKALNITITRKNQSPKSQILYKVQGSGNTLETETEKIIEAHYGYMAIKKDTYTFVIPINITSIRAQAMELLEKPLASLKDILATTHAGADLVEKKLLQALEIQTNINLKLVNKAIHMIKTYHYGQKRKTSEPFYTHTMEVAWILLGQTQDQDTIIAALLHDTVEDTQLSLNQLKAQFGPTIGELVNKLTNLEDNLKKFKLNHHEQIMKLIKNNDPRVWKIKLADRLHNMRTIGLMPTEKQSQKAQETLNFYMPMAKHLGLNTWADELLDLSLDLIKQNE